MKSVCLKLGMMYLNGPYNEEEAMRNAIQDSLDTAMNQIPLPNTNDQQVLSPVDVKVNRLLYAIDNTQKKIEELLKYDIKKTLKVASPKKKSTQNPLETSGGGANSISEQDRLYYLAEQAALRRQEQEEEEQAHEEEETHEQPSTHNEDVPTPQIIQPIEEGNSQLPTQSQDQIIMAFMTNNGRIKFNFPPDTMGEQVYRSVFNQMKPTTNSLAEDQYQIVDPYGTVLVRDKTLEEQHVRTKTVYSVRY